MVFFCCIPVCCILFTYSSRGLANIVKDIATNIGMDIHVIGVNRNYVYFPSYVQVVYLSCQNVSVVT